MKRTAIVPGTIFLIAAAVAVTSTTSGAGRAQAQGESAGAASRPAVSRAPASQGATKPGVATTTIWPPRPIPPRPRPPALNQELQLQSQTAAVNIRGSVATTKLSQTFRNVTNRTVEGTYMLPLPEGAAVTGFAMMVNGRRVEAEILEGDKARQIYNGIVQKMRDPAILEFIDRNLIRASIFPIAPHAEQKVELEYTQTLKPDAGSFRYALPLRLPTGGAATSTTVDITLESADGIRAVYSPTHNIEVRRDGHKARVTGEFGSAAGGENTPAVRPGHAAPKAGSSASRDFVLYYTADKQRIGVNLVTYTKRDREEDSYFMLLAAPDPNISTQEVAARDVVFVCDTSGSMGGAKIEQARNALLTILGNLNAGDRFNIITFSSDVRSFKEELAPATKTTIEAARKWVETIKAVGGTNINEALSTSFKLFPAASASNRPSQIIFMTDGQPTVGETSIDAILKNVEDANALLKKSDSAKPESNSTAPLGVRARLFVFGVGYDVNTRLLDTLAEENRGSSDYVLPEEDIEQKVGSLYGKIAYPVLTNPELHWKGRRVYDVYPKKLPDLFRGGQVVVFGRIADHDLMRKASAPPPGSVELSGWNGNERQVIKGSGGFYGDETNDALPRLWAMRKVGYLLDDARRNGRNVDGEVKEEIIRLSKQFGIVTPFTAGLITEDGHPTPLPRDREPWEGPIIMGGAADAMRSGSFAAAPPSGRGAVAAAKATAKWRNTLTASEIAQSETVRYIEGKTFTLKDGIWTDSEYDPENSPKVQVIKFASPEYFELLKLRDMGKWLSVGDSVIVRFLNRTVRIEP